MYVYFVGVVLATVSNHKSLCSLIITIDNYERQKKRELNCQQSHETEKFPHHEALECPLKC